MSFGIADIRAAAERIAPYIVTTPLLRLSALDSFLGCQVYAKAECMQITGAFKLRGAMNKILSLTPNEKERGVIAVSSGNHGRAVSYAAKMFGLKATVVMPKTAPRVKLEAIQRLGAEVILCNAEERYELADRLCAERGCTMLPPFDDEAIMAGQGTAGLEIMQQLPDVDMVISPVSGGGLISGVACAVKTLAPEAQVWGVSPALLPHFVRSLEQGEPVAVPQEHSVADALASRKPGLLTFPVVQQYCAGVVTVSDDEILQGQKLLLMEGKLLAEPSSAVGVAALLHKKIRVAPENKVCLVVSGGNLGFEQLDVLQKVSY